MLLGSLLRPSLLGVAISHQRIDGCTAALDFLLCRGFRLAVGCSVAVQQVVHARYETVEIACSHERECIRHGDAQWGLLLVLVVRLLEGVHPSHSRQALVRASVVECLHGGQFHRLRLCHLLTRDVPCGASQQRGHQTYCSTNLDALQGHLLLALLQQIPRAYGHREHGTDDPSRGHRVTELTHGKRREGHLQERHHLVAHRVGIELTAHGILHPRIGHENPPSRNGSTQAGEPGRCQVEALRDLVPTKVHHGHEGRLHEEGHDALDGERSTEDVAHEPRVVRPVRAELKLQDDARGNTHGEVDAKEFLPELRRVAPEALLRAIVAGLHDAHDHGQAERQGHKQPVVDGCQCELCTRPVYRAGRYVQ